MPAGDQEDVASSSGDDAVVEIENVRVVVRVRPIDKAERNAGSATVVFVDKQNRCISVTKPPGHQQSSSSSTGSSEPPKVYYFDSVFGEDSSQIDLYVDTARPIVDKVLEGYNGTILAYGQTGTGKTYTMSGNADSPQTKGILPNTFAHIFGHIAKAKDNQKFLVRVSYMEIYNEEVRDLLGKEMSKSLEVKERADIGVYVKDLSGYVVHNADDLDNIMKLGNKKRMVGATKMNVESSRSHAIFSITVESSEKDDKGEEHVKMGKLQLVDLAGSERQSKTQATGIRLKEATKINLSLSVLGNVISALVDGKSTHIPYRNSKLTRLLQDSLGGNSKTVMCASISPADCNYVETISTLRYAGRAKSIQNRAHVNEEPKDALLRHFQEEIAELKKQLEEGQLLDGVSGEEEADAEEDDDEEEEEEDDDDDADGQAENDAIENVREAVGESADSEARAAAKEKKKRQRRRKSKVQNDAEESEKSEAEKELLEKKARETEKELNQAKTEQQQLMLKLQSLENKILQGGENLLEKAKAQENLLDSSIAELEMRTRNERELNKQLQQKQAERVDIEERYSSLQEECVGKTKKLHRVMQMLMGVKSELADQQQEQQREKEGIYESIRTLSRELALCELVMNSYIPKEYQSMVERYTHWNEDIGEWQLKCVAYTGNNMHKSMTDGKKTGAGVPSGKDKLDLIDLSHVYLDYTKDALSEPVRPDSAAAMRGSMSGSMTTSMLARPKTGRHSGVPRPTTSRPYKAAM